MKRSAFLLAAFLLAGVALTTATAGTDAKRTICHRTASKKTPYVKISVTGKQLAAHQKHAADIIPVPKGGCPKTLLTASSGGRAFSVALTGEAEAPAGDPVATGTASIRLRAGQAQVCYQLAGENLPPAVAAHIHVGDAGTAGTGRRPVDDAERRGQVQRLRAGIEAARRSDPRRTGVLLRQHPHRRLPERSDSRPAHRHLGELVRHGSRRSTLAGSTEPNAKGTAVVRIRKDAGLVCYRLHAESITLPATAAHIHRGAATRQRPRRRPVHRSRGDRQLGGCAPAAAALIDEITATPAGFYVNVHTTEHPAGAMRAQLG